MPQNSLLEFLKANFPQPQANHEPVWRSLLSAAPLILAISLLTLAIHNLGWLRPFETTTVDTLVKLSPVKAQHVFVVGIDNSDYENLFKGKSPLDSKKLEELVDAIACGKPKVILVDIDTSPETFRDIKLPPPPTKVVWARAADFLDSSNSKADGSVFVPHSVLGQTPIQPDILWGIAIMPQDPDGIVRHYFRYVNVQPEQAGQAPLLAPTLSWAAVQAYRDENKNEGEKSSAEMITSFSGGEKFLPRISAGDLLSISKDKGWQDTVAGKIVLLGGFYDAARDAYVTPAGKMFGVEVQAEAIESELQRGGIHPSNPLLLLIAQIIASVIVVVLNCRFAGTWVPLFGFLLIPAIAFGSSLVCFSSLYLWADFVPVLFAVQLQYLFNHISSVRRQNLALQKANEELVVTKNELGKAVNRGAELERKRLAHELHDDTLGQLFQVSVSLQPLVDTTKDGIAKNAVDTTSRAMENIRKIIMNLYPPVLETFGLCTAIQDLIDHQNSSLVIELEDESNKAADGFDKDVQVCIYRIVQEALNNVRKHACATEVKIKMQVSNGNLILSVVDNGKGIEKISERRDSYGVHGVKTKAAVIGASVDWISPPDGLSSGTELRLSLQLSPSAIKHQA